MSSIAFGVQAIEAGARTTKAFQRARGLPDAVALAAGAGVWFAARRSAIERCLGQRCMLVSGLLAAAAPVASRAPLIRLIDATAVPKAGPLPGGATAYGVFAAPSICPPSAFLSSR